MSLFLGKYQYSSLGLEIRQSSSVGAVGIIWDNTLLIHSNEQHKLTNDFKLIAVDRNFGKIKGQPLALLKNSGVEWVNNVSYDWSMVAFGKH